MTDLRPDLPPCTVRENPRAKRLILKISAQHGLVVVIPPGFPRQDLPAILNAKEEWITRTWRRLAAAPPSPARLLPQAIELAAIGQEVAVVYEPGSPGKLALFQMQPQQIVIRGAGVCSEDVAPLLQKWLQHQGRRHLLPWLKELSAATNLQCRRVQIRGQKSRWGSCSARGTISLNYNLLFLRPAMVRYLLLHELCHTVHLNHSPEFYALLGTWVPDYQRLRREMRQAWQQIPWWALYPD
ncbi:MAG: M48 family metallopeptidase [Desulfobacca sp.]|uniref:M48 family metallopeptidase n=1 Tax=Desulfobacca sp. TaxID=2067990 RepID=UPI00404A70CC